MRLLTRIILCFAGDSGQGITSGTIAGLLIPDLITGKNNAWAEIYSPKRGAPVSTETVAGTGVRLWNTVEVFVLPFSRFIPFWLSMKNVILHHSKTGSCQIERNSERI